MLTADAIAHDLSLIKREAPLIHNITNFVVMQQTANALLALGASPVMAHAEEELQDIVAIARALVINIGTLDRHWLNSINLGLSLAKKKNIPVIVDPVGAGASELRTQSALALLKMKPAVIRGNGGEIMALAGAAILSKGVDSQYQSDAAFSAAVQLSQEYQCVVVVSGAQDLIVSGETCITVSNGTPMMTRVTGMGCSATALIGAFCSVNANYLAASAHAMAVMGIAGEMALELATGPGTLNLHFMDKLFSLEHNDIVSRLKLETRRFVD